MPSNPDPYTTALHKALEVFVSYTESSFDDVMSNGLRTIADAADIDRFIVVRVFAHDLHEGRAGEIYRWDRVGGGTVPVDKGLKVLPVTSALRRWILSMVDDTCVSLRRSEFKEDEAAFLATRGVMSILIVPVFTEGDLWGVVTFHDNRNEREFDEGCVALLRSTARLCASTIIREEKTKSLDQAMEALERREMMTSALNTASIIFLSESEEKLGEMMHKGVSAIADVAEIDTLVLYRSHAVLDNPCISQAYRWSRTEGGTTELMEDFANIPLAKVAPNWGTYFPMCNSVNSPTALLRDPEGSILRRFGILSVVVIPLTINNTFWGFALFGNTRRECQYEDEVVEMLRSAAFLFANAFIRAEVDYDALTGIYNRQFFDRGMKGIMRQHSRSEDTLSLMVVDIDSFKQYNDTYGHIEGDRCIKAVARALAQCLKREDDFVARYGGDEFVVVLPNTPEYGARMLADKMLGEVRNCKLPHAKSQAADHVTISVGVTTGKVSCTDKADDFVRKADEMLYKSKKDGRNRYSFGVKAVPSLGGS